MILIYSNKPHMGRMVIENIGEEIKRTYPNEKIIVINQIHNRNLQFNYPKKLTWSDYPYIGNPQYQFNTTNWSNWNPSEVTEKNTLMPIIITTEDIKEVTTVIYADDPFNTNCHNFDLFIQYFFADKKIETPALKLISLHKESIQKSWKERGDFYTVFGSFIKESVIKRFFNYNYNINSLGILGHMLKSVGIDSSKHHISKYSLQLLYKLEQLNREVDEHGAPVKMTEGKTLKLMMEWSGTGKYKRRNRYEGTLGSEMSRVSIMESLIEMKLVEIIGSNNPKKMKLTLLGELFLSKLHKDCRDEDLPFRYDLWQEEEICVAENKIKKYLEAFFGKQKRKLYREKG